MPHAITLAPVRQPRDRDRHRATISLPRCHIQSPRLHQSGFMEEEGSDAGAPRGSRHRRWVAAPDAGAADAHSRWPSLVCSRWQLRRARATQHSDLYDVCDSSLFERMTRGTFPAVRERECIGTWVRGANAGMDGERANPSPEIGGGGVAYTRQRGSYVTTIVPAMPCSSSGPAAW